jgi:hypothetical protein
VGTATVGAVSFSSRVPDSGSQSPSDALQQLKARQEVAAAANEVEAEVQAPGREARRAAERRAGKKSPKKVQAKKRTAPSGQAAPRQSRPADPPAATATPYQEVEAAPPGPPGLNRLLGNERRRAAALEANQYRAAASALRDVVADLDFVLATTATYISKIGSRQSRKSFQDAYPQWVTVKALTALPFDEVADVLDLPAPEMDDLFDRLVRNGGFIRTDRDRMLRDIRMLRKELQTVAITRNHSLLDRLVGIIVRIGQAIGIATVAAPVGAFAAGESAVNEAIVAGVSSLVGLALQQAVSSITQRRTEHNSAVIARKAYADLLAEIGNAGRLATPRAYEGEAAVLRFRLAVRCARARVASLPLEWSHKDEYWLELDDLLLALERAQYDAFDPILRRLETLTPPSH